MPKNGPFWQGFENLKLAVKQCYRSVLIGQKLVENAKIRKINMRHFEQFSNNVYGVDGVDSSNFTIIFYFSKSKFGVAELIASKF